MFTGPVLRSIWEAAPDDWMGYPHARSPRDPALSGLTPGAPRVLSGLLIAPRVDSPPALVCAISPP
jgi:hypothetical protein